MPKSEPLPETEVTNSSGTQLLIAFMAICATPVQSGSFAISSENIGLVEYLGQDRRIYASVNNTGEAADEPERWQFRYDPLFLPVARIDGAVEFEVDQIGEKWQLGIVFVVSNSEATQLVHRKLLSLYPTNAARMQSIGVAPLEMTSITLQSPLLMEAMPKAKIMGPIAFDGPASSFMLRILIESKEEAEALSLLLPKISLQYSATYDAVETRNNSVAVQFSALRDSGLVAKLNGRSPSSDVTYVHRDDLRNMMEGITRKLNIRQTIESPSTSSLGYMKMC